MAENRKSYFDTVRNLGYIEAYKLGIAFEKAQALVFSLEGHFGTSVTTSGKLLPAFGVVRDFMERSKAGEAVSLVDREAINTALDATKKE